MACLRVPVNPGLATPVARTSPRARSIVPVAQIGSPFVQVYRGSELWRRTFSWNWSRPVADSGMATPSPVYDREAPSAALTRP